MLTLHDVVLPPTTALEEQLMLVRFDDVGVRVRFADLDWPLKVAVTVAVCCELTVPVLAWNVADAWLALTETEFGMLMALFFERVTTTAAGTALFMETVHTAVA